MCFLEILTRTGRRPNALQCNVASLASQTDRDFKQTYLVDEVGRGVAWANKNLGNYASNLTGDFIWILDDDDECTYADLIKDLKEIVAGNSPDAVMCKVIYCDFGELPPYDLWGKSPEFASISMSNFFVKREIYQQYSYAFPESLGGDHAFISEIFRQENIKIYWWDQVVMRIMQIGRGAPE